MIHKPFPFKRIALLLLTLLGALAIVVLVEARDASAQTPTVAQPSPLHPTFPLLDASGDNVLDSGEPVSTNATCGACHDADYIELHSYHASVGFDHLVPAGEVPDGQPWDMSRSLFGRWDPLSYRYLTPVGDALMDMGTPDWIMELGERHAGGGPAVTSRDGVPLTELEAEDGNPEVSTNNPISGTTSAWDWQESGVVEMNCFLCHMSSADNTARMEALQVGEFQWANTATLQGAGITQKKMTGWKYNPDAFTADGELAPEFVTLRDPTSANCGFCHGTVHESKEPLLCADLKETGWNTERTGQIYSGQRLSDSGLNLTHKESLTFPWDIHAERNLKCTDCHYSLNNPDYQQESEDTRPEYLTYDPRRQNIGEYLFRPSHEIAKGDTAQHTVAPEFTDSMRKCADCHDTETTHDFLPYKETHMNAVRCESCHVPQMYTAAYEQNDWTVMTEDGAAAVTHRGIEGDCGNPRDLMTGFQPILLPQVDKDGNTAVAPFNLITSYYWVHGDPERPVREEDLRKVYLNNNGYQADVMALFDANSDGQLDETELRLDTGEKTDFIRGKLEALGLTNLEIRGDIQPYNINHNIMGSSLAIRECSECHSDNSRIAQPMTLGPYSPGGVTPQFVNNTNVSMSGSVSVDDAGIMRYTPDTSAEGFYLPGHNRFRIIDIIGWLAVLGVLAGIIAHGGYRLYQSARYPREKPELKEVYMYTFYERLWHWTQAIVILLLIATGIVIHRPDIFGWADFSLMVPIHNALAVLLVLNALFAAFYHLASGEIRQYLPEPRGFFNDAIKQVDFYLRGIFKGEPHPFEKTPEHKLNPLQQVTYFVILNLLLPIQVITGLLMFGALWWPQLAVWLAYMGPLHTLTAWFFVAFVILHIYLTTTGPTVTADLEGMVTGWDKVETQDEQAVA